MWVVKGSVFSLAKDIIVAFERTGCGCVNESAERIHLQIVYILRKGRDGIGPRIGTSLVQWGLMQTRSLGHFCAVNRYTECYISHKKCTVHLIDRVK